MLVHPPIGSCCARPKFSAANEVDECAKPSELYCGNLVNGARKFGRTTTFAVVAILAALVAYALILL
jgi:hypothetical protein